MLPLPCNRVSGYRDLIPVIGGAGGGGAPAGLEFSRKNKNCFCPVGNFSFHSSVVKPSYYYLSLRHRRLLRHLSETAFTTGQKEVLGEGVVTLLGMPADREGGRLVSQRTVLPELEFGFILI